MFKKINRIRQGYLAGIIEGEGYIGIVSKGRQIRLVVTSTNEELTRKLAEITGLGYSAPCPPRKDKRRIPAWQWFCFGRNAIHILRLILPQLVIKRGQAEIVLRFADYLESRQIPCAPISEKDSVFGCSCSEQIRSLNSRERNRRLLRPHAIGEFDLWNLL